MKDPTYQGPPSSKKTAPPHEKYLVSIKKTSLVRSLVVHITSKHHFSLTTMTQLKRIVSTPLIVARRTAEKNAPFPLAAKFDRLGQKKGVHYGASVIVFQNNLLRSNAGIQIHVSGSAKFKRRFLFDPSSPRSSHFFVSHSLASTWSASRGVTSKAAIAHIERGYSRKTQRE